MRSSVSTRCEKVQEGLPALEKPCHSFLRHCTPTSRPYSHLRKRHEQVQYARKTGFFRSLLGLNPLKGGQAFVDSQAVTATITDSQILPMTPIPRINWME